MDVALARSQATAEGVTNTVAAVIGGVTAFAYGRLTNIHLQGPTWRSRVIRPGRPWLGWITETYRIDSTATPLSLDVNASRLNRAGNPENLQVYAGPLRVSWSRSLFGLLPIGGGQTVSSVVVTLRYRSDANNQLLPCFNAADLEDANQLICADVTIPITANGRSCPASLIVKSNDPFRADTPQPGSSVYPLRTPILRVDPVCLFGR